MSFSEHRAKLFELLEDNSLVISYAGQPAHTNEDDYSFFEVNSQFFYLTGLEREGMIFLMAKIAGQKTEVLFIDEYNELTERWTGKMPTKEQATAVSGIENVQYIPAFAGAVSRFMDRARIDHVYFDTFRNAPEDLPDYNLAKALEFRDRYPGVELLALRNLTVPLRERKDADEVECMRKAIEVTKKGLEYVLKNLKPGMVEYEAQADFECACKKMGTKKFAFSTIAGSGINGCMMHYSENDAVMKDGSLLLLDLGAKYKNYCSDITRTYPVNGKYTERQKEYYELVLKANKAVAAAAKPGVTLRELNDLTKKILGEGLVAMGKIESVDQVGKYYMHSVSHVIGIDCHDAMFANDPLAPGFVISDEPGLYIDEEEIGIRIEDDLLITEDGCEVLSADVIREIGEIEAFMAK